MIFLCGPLRISAISALKKAVSAQRSQRYAEIAERESNWQGASAGKNKRSGDVETPPLRFAFDLRRYCSDTSSTLNIVGNVMSFVPRN